MVLINQLTHHKPNNKVCTLPLEELVVNASMLLLQINPVYYVVVSTCILSKSHTSSGSSGASNAKGDIDNVQTKTRDSTWKRRGDMEVVSLEYDGLVEEIANKWATHDGLANNTRFN